MTAARDDTLYEDKDLPQYFQKVLENVKTVKIYSASYIICCC